MAFAYDRAVSPPKTLAPLHLTTANMVVQSGSRYRRRTLRRWVVMAVAGSGGSQAVACMYPSAGTHAGNWLSTARP